MAMGKCMDLAVNIALGSSAQVALLIAPVLVFVRLAIGQPIHDRAWADDVTAVAFAHEDAETSVAAAAAAVRPERRGVLV